TAPSRGRWRKTRRRSAPSTPRMWTFPWRSCGCGTSTMPTFIAWRWRWSGAALSWMRPPSSSGCARSSRATTSSCSTTVPSTSWAPSTRISTRRLPIRRPPTISSRTRSGRRSTWASICFAAISRRRIRAIWMRLTDQAAARGRETLTRMIERDFNHPSVVIWTIINESWGVDLVNREFDRRWLKQMYHYVKDTDATRLVVDNSPCNMPQGRNFHLRTDIEDFHIYFAIPDHYHKWASWVKDFSTHPSWTFSYYGDAERTGEEPLVVSEFGSWGLPTLKDLLT